MAKAKDPNSMTAIARRHRTTLQTLYRLKEDGLDVTNDEVLTAHFAASRTRRPVLPCSSSPTATTPVEVTGTKGLVAAIERLREEEIYAHALYKDSLLKKPEFSPLFLKQWTAVLEALRKIEESTPAILKDNSASISTEELATTLSNLFRNLRQDLDSLPTKIALAGQEMKRAELETLVRSETSKIIDSLFDCKYVK